MDHIKYHIRGIARYPRIFIDTLTPLHLERTLVADLGKIHHRAKRTHHVSLPSTHHNSLVSTDPSASYGHVMPMY